jgi:hypothetical protein
MRKADEFEVGAVLEDLRPPALSTRATIELIAVSHHEGIGGHASRMLPSCYDSMETF